MSLKHSQHTFTSCPLLLPTHRHCCPSWKHGLQQDGYCRSNSQKVRLRLKSSKANSNKRFNMVAEIKYKTLHICTSLMQVKSHENMFSCHLLIIPTFIIHFYTALLYIIQFSQLHHVYFCVHLYNLERKST